MIIANYIAYILSIIGCINWGLIGIFNFNLVGFICMGARNGWSITIYILVFISALWLIISPIISKGMLNLGCQYKKKVEKNSK